MSRQRVMVMTLTVARDDWQCVCPAWAAGSATRGVTVGPAIRSGLSTGGGRGR